MISYVSFSEDQTANIVVDGLPNESTLLCLSHWRGTPTARDLWADTSTEVVLNWIASGAEAPASRVTNDHFDADGLLAMYAVINPQSAMELKAQLADAANTGDFDVVRSRSGARLAWTIDSIETRRSKELGLEAEPQQIVDHLYTSMLATFNGMLDEGSCRSLWIGAEEAHDESMRAIDTGQVQIEEHPGDGLAVVRYSSPTLDLARSALHTRTLLFRTLEVWPGGLYRYADRYETWVRYVSRRPLARVDLAPLADTLTQAEPSGAVWRADPPSTITPRLELVSGAVSALDADEVTAKVITHLRTAPVAWDPYA